MYTLILALAVGLVTSFLWIGLGLWGGLWLGTILGVLLMLGTSALLTRRISKRIEPVLQQVQRQVQAGQTRLALQSLEGLLPLGRWQLLLAGQLHAQIGSIHFGTGDEAKAMASFEKAHARVAEAQLMRAALLYKRKETERAKQVLRAAIKYNRKNALLHNTLAWMHERDGNPDAAMAQLQAGLKAQKDDKPTKDNLTRLQNAKKMSMKSFGMAWYGLQLEKVPNALRQVPQGAVRPGFRQPPRRRR